VEVVNVAVPAVPSVPVPKTVLNLLNVTVPVGGATIEEQLTAAVKTTLWPNNAGFADEVKLVVVGDTPFPLRLTVNRPLLVLS
jgi:hypothetical protein